MEPLPDINDIVSPAEHLPSDNFIWLYLIIGGMLIFWSIMGVLIYRIATKKSQTNQKVELHQLISEKLERLKSSCDTLSVSEVSQKCSEFIRSFLSFEYGSPALYQSKEEFLKSPPALKLEQSQRELVSALLNDLWAIEYSPSQINEEKSSKLIERTVSVFQQLHPDYRGSLQERIPSAKAQYDVR